MFMFHLGAIYMYIYYLKIILELCIFELCISDRDLDL